VSLINLLISLGHTYFFFLPIFFGEFQQENYANIWGHYGSKVMGIYSRPLNEISGSTLDLFWWYKLFIFARLCPFTFLGRWVLVAP
jgi:hypothetical protein